mmetsp:Transcript_12598/g.27713  ORF Transcript_12598/g.27713 Transcript_12598/m.27713 type:complete len:338 (-) Transcript_12598:376-1389(-)
MDAFSKVDDNVSKPVLGSDGAARWQAFSSQNHNNNSKASHGVAPKAPLKAADRAAGVQHWNEERQRENEARKRAGLTTSLDDKPGYTQFNNKKSNDDDDDGAPSAKERKRIAQRRRPDKEAYFVPSATFAGWKWDYIFTARPESEGTGYYWDGMDSLMELEGKRQRPATSSTTTSSSGKRKGDNQEDETNSDNDAGKTSQKKKKKKKKKPQTDQVTLVQDPTHPLEQVATLLQQRQLPPGWQSAKDPFSSKTYYYNATTGERTWTKPTTTAAAAANGTTSTANGTTAASTDAAATTTTTTTDLPQGWTEVIDANTGKVYYYNTQGETRWEHPTTSGG